MHFDCTLPTPGPSRPSPWCTLNTYFSASIFFEKLWFVFVLFILYFIFWDMFYLHSSGKSWTKTHKDLLASASQLLGLDAYRHVCLPLPVFPLSVSFFLPLLHFFPLSPPLSFTLTLTLCLETESFVCSPGWPQTWNSLSSSQVKGFQISYTTVPNIVDLVLSSVCERVVLGCASIVGYESLGQCTC